MLDLFHRGGPVMWPLLLSSVLALAVFLERLWSLRSSRIIPQPCASRILAACSSGDVHKALDECGKCSETPLARIAEAGLLQLGSGADSIRFMIAENGLQETARLDSRQRILATVAYIAPLLGLLGTVSGMIKAFETIAVHSVGDPSMLASGISEALISTAAGLSVAIPVVVMHRYIQSRASRLSLDLEKEAALLTDLLLKLENRSCGQVEQAPGLNAIPIRERTDSIEERRYSVEPS